MAVKHPNVSITMKEILSAVTQRGQVTVPAEVRRLLGLRTGDKVAFQIEDGQVRLAPAKFTLESAYGSVTPLHRPEDFEAIKEQALEAKVEEEVRRLRRSR
jgi:AbrB family looped-hinge helix DNA binding protein